jgi:hypothetical protein
VQEPLPIEPLEEPAPTEELTAPVLTEEQALAARTTLGAPMLLVFDVESVGLHGEGFAVGWVVGRMQAGAPDGWDEEASGRFFCHWDRARGTARDREWVRRFVGAALKGIPPTHDTTRRVRDAFWELWMVWRRKGAVLCADVPWPVESRFLQRCIDDDQTRAPYGPYPLLDVSSARWALGYGRIGVPVWGMNERDRRADELVEHDPLADARFSARLLGSALERLRAVGGG